MSIGAATKRTLATSWQYIRVTKPRESSLLVFIGFCAMVVAANGLPATDRLLLTLAAITLGSLGVNGLTNYLDRNIDARMRRTNCRPLPTKAIDPPEKALIFCLALTAIGLALAWLLNPWCFVAGSVGTVAAVVMRKTVMCPFLGSISGCAPVVIAWLAITPRFGYGLLVLCLLVCIWIPLHVWSVMLANRDDYMQGGVRYFPLNRETRQSVKVLFLLTLPLAAASIVLYFTAHLHWFYLATAVVLSLVMIYANVRLLFSANSKEAWRVYKLSAFPYLGIIFLAMFLDAWLLHAS
ncbi:MAG: protoheme IX farnesyltransferase [Dehalococcoidia bacterium]|nr:protoheme IX farnesyltransferase [Dehalococcoidia bacterium]